MEKVKGKKLIQHLLLPSNPCSEHFYLKVARFYSRDSGPKKWSQENNSKYKGMKLIHGKLMPLSQYFEFENFPLLKAEKEYRAANPQEFPSNPDMEDDYTLGLISQMLDPEPTNQESRQPRIVPRYPENSLSDLMVQTV